MKMLFHYELVFILPFASGNKIDIGTLIVNAA